MAFADAQSAGVIKDSGRGTQPGTVTLAGTAAVGDVLGYSSGWVRALATTGGVIQGRLIALADGKTTEVIAVSPNCVVGGRYSGATAGNPVYVAEGTSNGKITETIPTDGGDATTVVGIALSDTDVLFFLNSRADSTV